SQWTANLLADRAVLSAKSNPATAYDGSYTFTIPGNDDDVSWPFGDGYGAFKVDLAGKAKIVSASSLADNAVISGSWTLSKDVRMPFYEPLYKGAGSLLGWLSFTNDGTYDIHGDLSWIKPAQPTDHF